MARSFEVIDPEDIKAIVETEREVGMDRKLRKKTTEEVLEQFKSGKPRRSMFSNPEKEESISRTEEGAEPHLFSPPSTTTFTPEKRL
jgi:hypothetical protein